MNVYFRKLTNVNIGTGVTSKASSNNTTIDLNETLIYNEERTKQVSINISKTNLQ